MGEHRIRRVALVVVVVVGLAGCVDDSSPSADDFAALDADVGPSAVLLESVRWFRIAVMNGAANDVHASEFLSERCASAPLPRENPDSGLPENYTESIEGATATVSYDIRIFDYEAARNDPTATEIPTAEVLEIRDERWVRADGVWLWDDCDDTDATTATEDPASSGTTLGRS